MDKNTVLSLQEEPAELFRSKEFDQLLHYADTNRKAISFYWENKTEEDIQLFLKYATSKLVFFEKTIKCQLEHLSSFKLGELLGTVEVYASILFEKQRDQLAVKRAYEENHAIKYLDSIVNLLESHGGLTHTELCEHLNLKASTLSEAIKKVLASGMIDVRNVGKFKIYRLTETGIRYGQYLRNQRKSTITEDQLITLLKNYLEDASTSVQSANELKENFLEIFEIEGTYIKPSQRVGLHLNSPHIIAYYNAEISEIKNTADGITQITCHYDDPKAFSNNNSDQKSTGYYCAEQSQKPA